MSLTLYGYADAKDALEAVEVEIRSLEAGARASEGYTLDTLFDMRARLRRIIASNVRFVN